MNVVSVANRFISSAFKTVSKQNTAPAAETLDQALNRVTREILIERFNARFDERFNPHDGFEFAVLVASIVFSGGLYLGYMLVASIAMLANREELLQGDGLDQQLLRDVCTEIKEKILASKDDSQEITFKFKGKNSEIYCVKFQGNTDAEGAECIEQVISQDGKKYEHRQTNHGCSLPQCLKGLSNAFALYGNNIDANLLSDTKASFSNAIIGFFQENKIAMEPSTTDNSGWKAPIGTFGPYVLYHPVSSKDKVEKFIDSHKGMPRDRLLLVPYLAKYSLNNGNNHHMVLLVIQGDKCVAVDPKMAGIHLNLILPEHSINQKNVSVAHLNWQDPSDMHHGAYFVYVMVTKLIQANELEQDRNLSSKKVKTPQQLFDNFFAHMEFMNNPEGVSSLSSNSLSNRGSSLQRNPLARNVAPGVLPGMDNQGPITSYNHIPAHAFFAAAGQVPGFPTLTSSSDSITPATNPPPGAEGATSSTPFVTIPPNKINPSGNFSPPQTTPPVLPGLGHDGSSSPSFSTILPTGSQPAPGVVKKLVNHFNEKPDSPDLGDIVPNNKILIFDESESSEFSNSDD